MTCFDTFVKVIKRNLVYLCLEVAAKLNLKFFHTNEIIVIW